jgi:hypothetical protein
MAFSDFEDDDYGKNKRREHRPRELDENQLAELERRLKRRVEIAEEGDTNKRRCVWHESPTHDHDNDVFTGDKSNPYGKLSYNVSKEKEDKENARRSKKSSKKSKKKKSKKSKKHKSSHSKKHKKSQSNEDESSSSSNDEDSGSGTEIEAVEVNIDTMKKAHGSDEEDIELMILDSKKKQKQREKALRKLEEVGPQPDHLSKALDSKLKTADFGKALMPGEGAAMAKFVEDGKRIPRRGEIGLTSEEIERFETSGFVMSGSRHRRMEAVRLRKENQVYSADEKRALAKFNHEIRSKKEDQLMTQFRELIHSKQKSENN